MRPVLTAEEMRRADRHAIEDLGLPGAVLMENAGGAVVAQIQRRHKGARPVILCGRGNNGGDGFVVAHRMLANRPRVFLLGRREDVRGDARTHLEAFTRSGGALTEIEGAELGSLKDALAGADVIVDALLGTGLSRAPEGDMAVAIDAMAQTRRAGTPVIAVDIPSGVSSDTGSLPGPVAGADLTVTFAALKRGHVLPPACNVVGEVIVADIGIPVASSEARAGLIEAGDVAAALGTRAPDAHKGDFGHVLVVAGSLGKSGAAVLAGMGALRCGAGLVTVATPQSIRPVVAGARPELMTEALAELEAGFLAEEALEAALGLASSREAVVLGPGLGQAPNTIAFVREFVRRCPVPLVVDADGLNALAGQHVAVLERTASSVLTPHPGEMARLLGTTTAQVQADRVDAAARLGREAGAVVVLKGQRTLVVDPGGHLAINPTGNPGLASGGSGDVLAGMIGALLARGLPADQAASVGVYLHGAAGDAAADRVGQESLIAGDVLDHLGEAILKATGA